MFHKNNKKRSLYISDNNLYNFGRAFNIYMIQFNCFYTYIRVNRSHFTNSCTLGLLNFGLSRPAVYDSFEKYIIFILKKLLILYIDGQKELYLFN